MTTHIFNAQNRCTSTGRNLAILFAHARKRGGVSRITVDRVRDTGRALVNVWFVDGARGCTNFADYSHACEWARDRSALSPRVSWFAGCLVECTE